jgi:hypothetical protein
MFLCLYIYTAHPTTITTAVMVNNRTSLGVVRIRSKYERHHHRDLDGLDEKHDEEDAS